VRSWSCERTREERRGEKGRRRKEKRAGREKMKRRKRETDRQTVQTK
jgi:hypothetical protein